MDKDEDLRQEIRERIKELNIIRTDEGMPNISPLILSNPCVDEAIIGTTKNGQIVYSYDRIIDVYADDLLKEWNPKKKREEIKNEYKNELKGLSKNEKNKKIDDLIYQEFSSFFLKTYSDVMNFVDLYTIFPLNSSGNEVYFDDFDLDTDDFSQHGYDFFNKEDKNKNVNKDIRIVKPLIIYSI